MRPGVRIRTPTVCEETQILSNHFGRVFLSLLGLVSPSIKRANGSGQVDGTGRASLFIATP